ncbi:hypothetical protein D3C80_1455130 [compost metagenome]
MVQRFKDSAASFCSCLPTGVEPVSDTFFGMLEAIRCSEIAAGSPKARPITPAGTPASWKQRVMPMAVPGVSLLGLTMIEQPAASAPAIFSATLPPGKFHAANPRAGPTGSRRTVWRTLGLREGTMRP